MPKARSPGTARRGSPLRCRRRAAPGPARCQARAWWPTRRYRWPTHTGRPAHGPRARTPATGNRSAPPAGCRPPGPGSPRPPARAEDAGPPTAGAGIADPDRLPGQGGIRNSLTHDSAAARMKGAVDLKHVSPAAARVCRLTEPAACRRADAATSRKHSTVTRGNHEAHPRRDRASRLAGDLPVIAELDLKLVIAALTAASPWTRGSRWRRVASRPVLVQAWMNSPGYCGRPPGTRRGGRRALSGRHWR
jgi:hypothetical protein